MPPLPAPVVVIGERVYTMVPPAALFFTPCWPAQFSLLKRMASASWASGHGS